MKVKGGESSQRADSEVAFSQDMDGMVEDSSPYSDQDEERWVGWILPSCFSQVLSYGTRLPTSSLGLHPLTSQAYTKILLNLINSQDLPFTPHHKIVLLTCPSQGCLINHTSLLLVNNNNNHYLINA